MRKFREYKRLRPRYKNSDICCLKRRQRAEYAYYKRMERESGADSYLLYEEELKRLVRAFVRCDSLMVRCYGNRELSAADFFCLGLRNGWPILFEHSNALREHVDLYKKIKSLGYRIHMVCIDATPEMVIKRLARRNRFFPEEQVKKRWDCLIDLLPEYQKIVDDFKLIQPWKNVENL